MIGVWGKLLVLIGCGAAALWWLAGRVSRDRWLRRILLGSFAVRLLVAGVFFAGSWWRWPFLFPGLQLGKGFWIFGLDSRAYHHFGRIVAESWAKGFELPRPEIGFEYIAFVAGWYRLLGAHPLYPIAVNCWLAALNGLLAYLIGRRLAGHRAALLGATLVGFWPSSLVWSSQLLKDPLSWTLLFAAFWLAAEAVPAAAGALRRGPAAWLRLAALFAVVVLLTRVRFYLGSALSLAALMVFVPAAAMAWKRRQLGRGLRHAAIALSIVCGTLFGRTFDLLALTSPAHPEQAHFRWAVRYLDEGEFKAAQAEFANAIGLDAGYHDAYLGLAAAQVHQGKMQDALKTYLDYLALADPQRQAIVRQLIAHIYLDAGNQAFQTERWASVIPNYEQALLYQPGSTEVYAQMAFALAEQYQPEQANEMFEQAIAMAKTAEEQQRIKAMQRWLQARAEWLQVNDVLHGRVTWYEGQIKTADPVEAERLRAEKRHFMAEQELCRSVMLLERSLVWAQTEELQEQIKAELERIDATPEQIKAEFVQYLLAQEAAADAAAALRARPAPRPAAQAAGRAPKPASMEPPDISVLGQSVRELAMAAFGHEPARKEAGARAFRQVDLLAHSMAQMDDQAFAMASETTPQALGNRRQGFVASGGYSLMDPSAIISNPGRLLRYAPRALAIGLLAPFPGQWFDTRGSTGIMRALAGVEMALWYLLLPLSAAGTWRLLRRRRARLKSCFLLAAVFATALSISLVVANMGSLFRLRLLFLLPLLIVAAAADPRNLYRRFGRWAASARGRGERRATAPGGEQAAAPVEVLR